MPSDEIIETMARAMQASKAWPVVFQAGTAAELSRAALSAAEAAGWVMVPKELLAAVRKMLRSEYESAAPGLCDCVDNDGKHYQSAFLAKQIEVVDALMPEVRP